MSKLDIKKFFEERYKVLPVDSIKLAGWNYKETDTNDAIALMEKLKNNLTRNNQVENIIVRTLHDGSYEVCNGNHRVMAFKELGQTDIICCDLGNISLKAAQRLSVETNQTKFKEDSIKLAQLVFDIQQEFGIEDVAFTSPYTIEDLNNYSKLVNFNWNKFQEESTQEDEEDKKDEEMILTLTMKYPAQLKPYLDQVKDKIGSSKDEIALKRMLEEYLEVDIDLGGEL